VNEGESINRSSKFGGEDRLLRKGRNMKGRRQGEEEMGETKKRKRRWRTRERENINEV